MKKMMSGDLKKKNTSSPRKKYKALRVINEAHDFKEDDLGSFASPYSRLAESDSLGKEMKTEQRGVARRLNESVDMRQKRKNGNGMSLNLEKILHLDETIPTSPSAAQRRKKSSKHRLASRTLTTDCRVQEAPRAKNASPAQIPVSNSATG